MKGIIQFLEKYFVPVAGRIGSQRHLVAIRDGFVAIMPLIIAGSMAVLINSLPIPAYQTLMTSVFGDGWKAFGGNVWMGSFAIFSLLVSFTIGYNLAKSYGSDAVSGGIISVASLLAIMTPAAEAFAIPYGWVGAQGLFVAIIVAIISVELYVRLCRSDKLVIKMPENVPPAVSKSFASLFPLMIVISIFSFIKIGTVAIGIENIHQAVFNAIQTPLSGFANTMGSAVFIVFMNQLLWFFGLHGSNILEPVMQTLYLPAIEANMAAFQAGTTIPHIVTKQFFDAFVHMGGSGTTIALIAAIYMASKSRHLKTMANLSAGPGLFNINESMIFGMPIVLNPVFIIPFVLGPVLITIVSYLALASGMVPKTIALIPWTTPPIIGGYLATGSWRGSVLQIINLGIAIVTYIPFVIMAERLEEESTEKKQDSNTNLKKVAQ